MDIRLWDGRRGQACVTGRDDDLGLALLQPLIDPSGAYDYLAFSSASPSVGQQLELFQHARLSPVLYQRTTKVAGYRSSAIGFRYLLVEAADNTTADGAVLLDEGGRMVGMRMPALWLLQNQITNPGEVAAVDASTIEGVALPALRSDRMHILAALSHSEVDTIPWLSVIFHGELTVDGAPAPAGTMVHARVSAEGEPDYWQSTPIGMVGEYVFPVSDRPSTYSEGTVEFWVDCKRFPSAIAFEGPSVTVVEQDLAF